MVGRRFNYLWVRSAHGLSSALIDFAKIIHEIWQSPPHHIRYTCLINRGKMTLMPHITNEQIAPDLRSAGRTARTMIKGMSVKTFRRSNWLMAKFMKGHFPSDLNVQTREVARPDGSWLRLLVVLPKDPKPLATGVLWLHGGGYAIGLPEMDFAYVRRIQQVANAVVVLPDYRLATEAPYPAALDDAYLSLTWLRDNAINLGVNPRQLFVAGESAGGGLTAALLLYNRDHGNVDVAFQMPLYPMLDDRPTETNVDNDAPVWDSTSNENAWNLYLGELAGTKDVPIYAAPGRASNLEGLPPAYTFIGTIEPFYAETLTYVRRLRAAGIRADLDRYRGGFHALDLFGAKKPLGKEATARWQRSFRDAATHNYSQIRR